MSEAPRVVSVEILGQHYPIRSPLDSRYVADLAAYVDEKIRSTADITATTDTVRLAVLAALNMADELFHARDEAREQREELLDRVARLEQLIDGLLLDREGAPGPPAESPDDAGPARPDSQTPNL